MEFLNTLGHWAATPMVGKAAFWIACFFLALTYVQSGIGKLSHISAAAQEFEELGLKPGRAFVLLSGVVEVAGALMVMTGFGRWIGSLLLAGFTIVATFVAIRFWAEPTPEGKGRMMSVFLEHLGVSAAFLLIAVLDLQQYAK